MIYTSPNRTASQCPERAAVPIERHWPGVDLVVEIVQLQDLERRPKCGNAAGLYFLFRF
jgi:hypothetical protein